MPDGTSKINPDAVAAVGKEFEKLADALDQAAKFAAGALMKPPDFGGTPNGTDAAERVLAAAQQLGTSIGYVAQFSTKTVEELVATVQTARGADEASAQGVRSAGKGL